MELPYQVNNHDYMFFICFYGEKYPSVKRTKINKWAAKYGINHELFKTKKLVLEQLILEWERYFQDNPDFFKQYQETLGEEINFKLLNQ